MDAPGCSNWQQKEVPEAAGESAEEKLLSQCDKKPYLDGQYFKVDVANSKLNSTITGVCQLCTTTKVIRGPIGSSNFKLHLKRHHEETYADYEQYESRKRAKLEEESRAVTGRKATCTFSQKRFEQNVAQYVLESMAPFSTVEMHSFRKIFDDLDIKQNNVPLKHLSRRKLASSITEAYNASMATIRANLANAIYVCTTADLWSCSTRRILGVTVHWIEPGSYMRRSAAIACRRFMGEHTHLRIAEMLRDIHDEFAIGDKIVGVLTDNASNFAKAFQEFGVDEYSPVQHDISSDAPQSSDEELQSDQEAHASQEGPVITQYDTIGEPELLQLPRHFRCVCHTLNLIGTADAGKIIKAHEELHMRHQDVMKRCNALWKVLRFPKQRETLFAILGQSLMRPVAVRWNSLYSALHQILQLKEKIMAAYGSMDAIKEQLSSDDFAYIAEYTYCVKPIAETIGKLQGEKYIYYGYVTPSIVNLRRTYRQLSRDSLSVCGPLVTGLEEAINRRFSDYFNIINNGRFAAIAAITHPQFKKRWVNCISPLQRIAVEEAAVEAVKAHSIAQAPQEAPDKDEFFDFGEDEEAEQPTSEVAESELELGRFLKEPWSTSLQVLDSYPTVRNTFLYFNTPLPSSAPVERLFSYATMMSISKYNRLSDNQFEIRVLTKCNANLTKAAR